MRLRPLLLISSFAALGSAIAMTGHQEPLAEQQFKNIKSFKGSKASDIIPAMEFMSASLGVSCDYCHTDDRSSDEKHPKEIARSMIAMQRDINDKHFGGRNRVTCATCHGGHEGPNPMPPVAGAEVRARRSQDVVPDQVLASYGKAVGGDMAHPIPGLRLEGTSEAAGQKTKLEAIYSGEKFIAITHDPKGDVKKGFNGELLWFTTPKGTNKVPLVYGAQFVRMNTIYTGPSTLPKLNNPTGGTAKIGDRDALVVTGTLEGEGTRVSLFFDKQSGLLVRSAYYYPSVLGNLPEINDYSDYRKVGGVELPMTIANHSEQGDAVARYRSVRVDSKVDASVFEPPK